MNVRDWMTREVRTCRPDESLQQAAEAMWNGDCGLLPVVDEEQCLLGVITDRDAFMGALFQGGALTELPVHASMSRVVFSCKPEDPIEETFQRLAQARIRRLPVVDDEGKLAGIVSLRDLAVRLAELPDGRERTRLLTRLLETLAALGERNGHVPLVPVARETRNALARVS